MIVSEAAEEILEALWISYEEEKHETLSLSELRTAPEIHILKELLEAKIIEHPEKDKIKLTEKGLHHARDAVRRHRLAERLLTDVLAVKSSLIHDTACKFEHHLHKGIDSNVCTLLGHPKFCPHGKPIPPGNCCKEESKSALPAVSKLSTLGHGQDGHIAYLHTLDPKRAQMLISMGVVPGAPIKLLASFPSYLFKLGEGQYAVDSSIAGEIYVRLG
ncbi:MAG: metal-dependent transcriptional regulator [Deltaproteobacteria bacterium]|nr:metal-dependent transcriptional regulator [Deltaproteobacteria bacterium]